MIRGSPGVIAAQLMWSYTWVCSQFVLANEPEWAGACCGCCDRFVKTCVRLSEREGGEEGAGGRGGGGGGLVPGFFYQGVLSPPPPRGGGGPPPPPLFPLRAPSRTHSYCMSRGILPLRIRQGRGRPLRPAKG